MTITLPRQAVAVVPEFSRGDRLRKARENAGFEKAELAQALGVHRQSVARYERDEATPSVSVLVVWALVTQVDLEWIKTGQCTPRDSNSEPTDSSFTPALVRGFLNSKPEGSGSKGTRRRPVKTSFEGVSK